MRARVLVSTLLVTLGVGCGDGIGQPIVSNERESGANAGLGGAAGSAGTAASELPAQAGGGAGNAGSVESGGTGGSFGPGGTAGTGGFLDLPPAWEGLRGGDGPDRDDDRFEEDARNAVPPSEYCASVVEWDEDSGRAEQEIFRFLNYARQSGLVCAEQAAAPVPPLALRPELRCSARLHSRDMVERAFFAQVNPDGVGPEERMRRAGYAFRVAAESIAEEPEMSDFADPYDELTEEQFGALRALFETAGSDCSNLQDARFDAVGVGVFEGFWTLDFAGP